jgi:cytochrome c-type biogenesis protein CcmH/NrfG
MKSHLFVPCSGLFALTLFLTVPLDAQTTSPSAHPAAELIGKNDLAAAEALLEPLTGDGSQDAAAFFQLGSLRLKQQRAGDAVAAFEKAGTLDPGKAEYFSHYAIALSTKMQGTNIMSQAMLAPRMKKAFERSLALDPNHLAGLIGLARYYAGAPEIAGGSLEKATEFAERVRKQNPFLGALELGHVAERADDPATALAHYEAAGRLQPNNAALHASAGRMLAKLGRSDEARARFARALELDPRRESASKALAELGPAKQ